MVTVHTIKSNYRYKNSGKESLYPFTIGSQKFFFLNTVISEIDACKFYSKLLQLSIGKNSKSTLRE